MSRSGGGRQSEPSGPPPVVLSIDPEANAFSLAENVYDKLKILSYDTEFLKKWCVGGCVSSREPPNSCLSSPLWWELPTGTLSRYRRYTSLCRWRTQTSSSMCSHYWVSFVSLPFIGGRGRWDRTRSADGDGTGRAPLQCRGCCRSRT